MVVSPRGAAGEARSRPQEANPPGHGAAGQGGRGAAKGAAGSGGHTRTDADDRTRTERPSPDPWAPGRRVAGKYEVIELLGSGGFGRVYKVRHIFRKKYYALKTPHTEFLRDEVFRRRFEREIEAMERFAHPDAVMIRDCGVTEFGIPYYTMDFIEGESLRSVLLREHRLPADRALGIVRRVLRVLEVAHEHQIIHRDIKPDNILLTWSGAREQVKVLDFGVAKLLDLVGWTSITHEARVGTPRYMSPEQITGDVVDARSDLFSLGIIFYEMVTGEHPFARDHDPIRVTGSILNRAAAPPRDLAGDLPRQLSERILWMLEKKPRKRPPSARALLDELPDPQEERPAAAVRPAAMELDPAAPRAVVGGLVLRQEGRQGERRSFLLFKERVTFGRSGGQPAEAADLVLRCLPCRSAEQDPDNWRRNLTISHRIGCIYPDASTLIIEPDARSPNGLALGGVRSPRPARILADRFHLSVGERALEIDGYRRLRSADRERLDLGFLARRRPPEPPPEREIGYSRLSMAIDHVHLRRADNWPLHEYFLVYRQIPLGSAAAGGLRLDGEGIEGEHAIVLYEEGEAFLSAADGEVRIARPVSASALRPSGWEDVVVRPGRLYPLVPGIQILIGTARLRVEAITPEWYKRV